MSREYFRKKLSSILEIADDEGFLQLIWAANSLQSGFSNAGIPFLQHGTFTRESITEDMSDRTFIYKWELETLVNELLTVPKRTSPKRRHERALNIANYDNIARAANYLRKLENSESARRLSNGSIFLEMARIANRQFDWQRGYFNVPQFYRNAFIYGQGACSAYFEAQYGITVNQLSLVGFGVYVTLTQQPTFGRATDMSAMGINRENLTQALNLISLPFYEARSNARDVRRDIYHTSYRPSILRQSPCIAFGEESERIMAPLPQLVLERVTAGVFYDVIGGGGAVRADYGKRFEQYCLAYFRAMLPGLNWLEETSYRVNRNSCRTPDILCLSGTKRSLALECKASRMSHCARFGEDPLDDRGFEDMIKAVYQLWRFFSHCRRGLTGYKLEVETMGIVLTLDGWLVMANPLRVRVMLAARQMASDKDPLIIEADCLPVAFVAITDLEATLVSATEQSFLDAARATANPKYEGWILRNVHDYFAIPGAAKRAYPFRAEMGQVLPWWDAIEEEKAKRLAEWAGD